MLYRPVRSPLMSPRERLLDAASSLFYEHGIAATGVDAVVRASGVSKPTLYAHFGDKAGLVAAVLDARHARRQAELRAWVARAADPIAAVFDYLADFYACDGSRGCAFLNAAAEGAAPEAVAAEKRWLEGFLTAVARSAGRPDPERTGSQLLLLVDGISGRVVVQGPDAAPAAIADARALV
jgi:AcrR family transcriptional regulator